MQMIYTVKISILSFFSLMFFSFNSLRNERFEPKVVYKTNDLIITQISKNAFEHTSFLITQEYGKVPCNGLIIKNKNEALIFDTTVDDTSSEELINWVNKTLGCKIRAIIPSHFHEDNLGGLKAFHKNNIASYAHHKTIKLAKQHNLEVPKKSINDSITLKVGNKNVIVKFFGEGHTKDNIVGYFPSEKILFGGCLIKSLNARKGNLNDANVKDWSKTVEKVKKEYPNVKVVVPGHGKFGSQKLLDYTIEMFKAKN